ncbi:MAG TPA: hypothetical protein VMW91_10655, partial [Desulfosporosinus sp.]|nr:hypothetical protein [Desulfosporosinus sp.]
WYGGLFGILWSLFKRQRPELFRYQVPVVMIILLSPLSNFFFQFPTTAGYFMIWLGCCMSRENTLQAGGGLDVARSRPSKQVSSGMGDASHAA